MIADLGRLYRGIFGQPVLVDLKSRSRAFRAAFCSPDGKRHILPDLLEFTGVLAPAPVNSDPVVQARAQGRRDVGLHILENLTLEPHELYAILKGTPIIRPGDFSNC